MAFHRACTVSASVFCHPGVILVTLPGGGGVGAGEPQQCCSEGGAGRARRGQEAVARPAGGDRDPPRLGKKASNHLHLTTANSQVADLSTIYL